MPFAPDFTSHRTAVVGTRGTVASTQPAATAAGLRVLSEGGNAADAAVATAAALSVTEPNSTGLGGDCFALYYDAASGDVSAMNGSGRAPAALTLERLHAEGFQDRLPSDHGHTITVPGTCAGWCDFVERHGTLPMTQILAPAISLAEDGFPVAPINAFLWHALTESQLQRGEGARELLIDGRSPRPGEIFRNPTLARSLRVVAEQGKKAFYEGPIGEAIARTAQQWGGALEVDDLAAHTSTWETPISTTYRDVRVWECPPNGQGLAALLCLNLVRGMGIEDMDPLGPDRYHVMIEAMRLAFADAAQFIADPAQVDVPVEALLSEAYAEERRRLIDPSRAMPEPTHGTPIHSSDTVYFCTADAHGNACSFVNSNYQGFGTGLVPEGCGFPLQNRGFGFSLQPGHPNVVAPGKRPYHTIIPGMITRADGSLYGPFGVMGGFMQPQGHAQVVVAMIDDGLDPQAALDRPRFKLNHGVEGRGLIVEPELPEATRGELERRGHSPRVVQGFGRIPFGRGQIIRRDPDGVLWGGADPRADSIAMTL